jgi:L-ascorbate metabolism protein UlaG (beta-lactamase superfamily)
MASQQRQATAPPSRSIGPEAFQHTEETALWWLTGAGFLLNCHGTLIMVDPVIEHDPASRTRSETGLPLLVALPLTAGDVPRLDAVLYTHSDDDHIGSRTPPALVRTGARFVGPPPVVKKLLELGVPQNRVRVATTGQTFAVGPVQVTLTPADHGYQVQNPAWGPPFGPEDCCGFLLRTPDGSVWHTGDTRLLEEHLRMQGVDVLLLDVSRDAYHLGIEGAIRLANALAAADLIPHHYGTYEAPEHSAFNGDPAEVQPRIGDAARRMHVLAPGERFVVRRRG